MSALVSVIPALDELLGPHLLVVGAWHEEVLRVLLHRQEARSRDQLCPPTGTVCLIPADPRDFPGPRTIAGGQLDLLGALGGTADSLTNLRSLILPVAQQQGPQVATVLEGILRAQLAAAPHLHHGLPALRLRFPATMSPGTAGSLLDDMVQHAGWSGHPLPRVRSAAGARPFAGDAREARIALEGGRVRVEDLVVHLPVHEASDWRPYAAHAVYPDLAPGHREAAQELEVEALSRRPEYRHGDAQAIRALAHHRVEQHLWELAWERATAAEGPVGPLSSQVLVRALCDRPETASFGQLLERQLTGARPLPAWWDGSRWLVGTDPREGLRTAILIEAIAEQAAGVKQVGEPKLLVVDGALLSGQPGAVSALERLLRAGRKHHCRVLVHAATATPEVQRIAVLCASWLVDADADSKADAGESTLFTPPPLRAGERPRGWWLHSHSRQPEPLGSWFTTEEVVAGDRLLSGVTYA